MNIKNNVMKQILLTLLLTLFVSTGNAQTEHMKFMGIPMEGTIQEFSNKLQAKGFTIAKVYPGNIAIALNGDFAGYRDCAVGIVGDISGRVCKINVIFPAMDKWSELERCYNDYKSMLSEKYGKPKDCVEKFQNISNDDLKKSKLKIDNCNYYSVFDGNNREIELKITPEGSYGCIVLIYSDGNPSKVRKQIINDL